MASFWQNVQVFFGFGEENEETKRPSEPQKTIKEQTIKQPIIRGFKGSLVHSQNAHPFASSEIKIEEPRIYEDSLNIATYLREGKPVIVNLKYLDKSAGKRLVDFVCGTAYAINGHMLKIGENIFLFTPENVRIADSEEKTVFEQGLDQEEKEVFFKKAAL